MARSDGAGRHVPPPHRNVPAETRLLSPYTVCGFGGLDSGRSHATPEAASTCHLVSRGWVCLEQFSQAWLPSCMGVSEKALSASHNPQHRKTRARGLTVMVSVSEGGTCYRYLGRESRLSPGDLGGKFTRKAGNSQCPIEESPSGQGLNVSERMLTNRASERTSGNSHSQAQRVHIRSLGG